jgi:hypothetical protein
MKNMGKKSGAFALAVGLTFGFCVCKPQIAAAAAVTVHHPRQAAAAVSYAPQIAVASQAPVQSGVTTYGIFGSRTLGQSFVPSPSTFGGTIQTGPSGEFIGRAEGSSVMGTQNGGGPAAQPFLPPQWQNPQNDSGMNAQDLGALEQALGATAGFERSLPRADLPPAAVVPSQPFLRSPELSERITRIARSKNMLSGQDPVDVYMSNGVALVQGTVRTRDAGVLLLNILSLEPQVRQIDNRLFVTELGPDTNR